MGSLQESKTFFKNSTSLPSRKFALKEVSIFRKRQCGVGKMEVKIQAGKVRGLKKYSAVQPTMYRAYAAQVQVSDDGIILKV